jgi:hypothetical protein
MGSARRVILRELYVSLAAVGGLLDLAELGNETLILEEGPS